MEKKTKYVIYRKYSNFDLWTERAVYITNSYVKAKNKLAKLSKEWEEISPYKYNPFYIKRWLVDNKGNIEEIERHKEYEQIRVSGKD